MSLPERDRRKAAALARLKIRGQLSIVDVRLMAAEASVYRCSEADASIAEVHISEARRLLKEILGAVEVSG